MHLTNYSVNKKNADFVRYVYIYQLVKLKKKIMPKKMMHM